MDLDKQANIPVLEAMLFSSDEPLKPTKIKEILKGVTDREIREMVEKLNADYEATGRSFRIHAVAGGYQLFTLPDYSDYIDKLFKNKQQSRLSLKALETLAIIAYQQPVTRHDIEGIRGVNSDGVLKTLLTRKLITIAGTAKTPGTPYLYKTTDKFLEYFGLKSLKDLPKLKELDEIVEADSEIQERYGNHILKEVAPEVLGIHETDDEEEN